MRSTDELMAWIAHETIGRAAKSLTMKPGECLGLEASCALIDAALDNLDTVFEHICRKYSHFALLVSIQHHVPLLLVPARPDEDGDGQELFSTMSVVAFKFASKHRDARIRLTYRDYRRNPDRFFGTVGDVLREDLALLQLGVRTQRSLQNTKRTVNKGAALRLSLSGTAFELDYPQEVSESIRVYENRAWKTANALGWQGFFVPLAPMKNDDSFDFPLTRIDWASLRAWDHETPLSLSPLVVSMDSLFFIFHGSLFFQEQVANQFSNQVYITDFFAFLHSVWVPTLHRLREGIAPYGWGYDFWSWKSFRNMMVVEGPTSYAALFNLMWRHLGEDEAPVLESLTPGYWSRVYRKLLAFVAYDSNQPSLIHHRDLYPAKYLFITEQGIFAHLCLFPHFLHSLWSTFEMTGDIGSEKGPAFEQWSYGFLASDDFVPVWGPSRPFPFKVGRRTKTDIDLFFRKGSVGFVISCKSYANTRETYKGEQRAVWLRWIEIQSWVKENDELADAMVKHATSMVIPDDIKLLVSVVCVPQVEYLWDTSEYYMLTPELPRVLTPWELKEWVSTISEEGARRLPHVRIVG